MMKNYLLKNGNIIDVTTGEIFIGSIEIDDGFIKRIAPGINENILEHENVIDVTGKYLIPGLIDMHCHINEGYAPHFVASGVTTVRNTAGNVLLLDTLIQAPIDAPTPLVYSADRMIDGSPGLWGPSSFGNLVTDDPEVARKEVRRQVEVGAKFIKVYGLCTKEVMEAVVEEATKSGLEVSCDLIHSQHLNALDAAKIGVTWFEHTSGFVQALYPNWHPSVSQEIVDTINWNEPDMDRIKLLCEEMLKYNVKLCPTFVLTNQAENLPDFWNPNNTVTKSLAGSDGMAANWANMSKQPDGFKRLTISNQIIKEVTKTYFDLGGTVVAGTDTPALVWTWPGMALHRELELFVEIGFTELEALQAATIRAAESINLHDIGSIREGNIADIVVLTKNPLEEISNTKEISKIIKGGKIFSQQEVLDQVPDSESLMQKYIQFEKEFSATVNE